MALQLFNTLSRSVVPFEPLNPDSKKIGMYCCGPTVHNFAHIGNFRTFVCSDFVRRYLTFRGFEVRHVMNITDVEDKIIAAVRKSGRALKDYTGEFEKAFLEDFDALNCLRPNELPHATDFVAEIISVIEALMQRGFAYRANDGSVYFSIETYRTAGRKYGQLLNLKFEELRVGERVSADEYAKEAVADFALWKARVPEDGLVFWPSPWGEGRPGWHIECSAMSMKILGPSFDLHLGGEDLIFPHHEDEIAQSEGSGAQSAGKPFVKHWLHVAHLLVEGRKMSKSLGNYFTVRDLLAKGFTGREIRYLLLSSHYRESFNFTFDGLAGARTALGRIDELIGKLRETAAGQTGEANRELLDKITKALDEDLNVAAAWGHIFDWVRNTNRELSEGKVSPPPAAAHLAAWERIDAIFGVGAKAITAEVPPEILALLEQREAARKARNFARADEIRNELKAKGWVIEDTPKGPRLKKL
jgi:cysteinyl-tRNA synthetase